MGRCSAMAPFLVHSAQSDDMQCWQPLEMSGEYQTWESCDETAAYPSVNCELDFCGTWQEAVQVTSTPYKPRGKPWESEHEGSLATAEKTSSFASQGSLNHANGGCKPCAWFWKAVGCSKGKDCIYCHLCLEGELKMRRKAKMAALRSGQLTAPTSETPVEPDADVETHEEQSAPPTPEVRSSSEVPLTPAILPIQLESLLPDVQASPSMRVVGHVSGDFVPMAQKVAASAEATSLSPMSSSSTGVFPSLPRSAPPCGPPVLQNFDITPPPPPLQDPSSCDIWQWEHDSALPWLDGSAWLGYPQDQFCMNMDLESWEAIEDSSPMQCILTDLRSSPPEVVGEGKSLWRLPSSPSSQPQSPDAQVLVIMRRGMINAFEVVDPRWDPTAESRCKSCPAEIRCCLTKAAPSASESPGTSIARGHAPSSPDIGKSTHEASTPSRRQAQKRASYPGRMIWRKKSDDRSPETPPQKELVPQMSPSHRGGRPRVGRVGPRGPAKAFA